MVAKVSCIIRHRRGLNLASFWKINLVQPPHNNTAGTIVEAQVCQESAWHPISLPRSQHTRYLIRLLSITMHFVIFCQKSDHMKSDQCGGKTFDTREDALWKGWVTIDTDNMLLNCIGIRLFSKKYIFLLNQIKTTYVEWDLWSEKKYYRKWKEKNVRIWGNPRVHFIVSLFSGILCSWCGKIF